MTIHRNFNLDSDDEHTARQVVRRRKIRIHCSTSKKRKENYVKRMRGEGYLGFDTADGWKQTLLKSKRQIGPTCLSPACKKISVNHCEKFNEVERNEIFKEFWNMSWESKRVFLKSYVTVTDTKRKTIPDSNRRKNSCVFKLPHKKRSLKVCRKMFLSTLAISKRMIDYWVVHPPISPALIRPSCDWDEHLKDYFQKLEKMESHYCRKDSSKIYIAATFKTKAEIYRDYKTKCLEKKVHYVSIFTFSKYFAEQNFALFMPRKDECNLCVGFKTKQITAEEYNEHISRKQLAQEEKQRDKIAAQQNQCYVFTMDAQAVKLCPNINASAVYFKQRLQVHNFTVYNLASHQCTNYWWNETNGDLSASTFISIILHHLTTYCLSDRLPIIIYSDGCGYQNRNHYLSNAISNFAIKHDKIIEQKYLEKGHTQMECDSAHAKIEVKLKNEAIYIPNDYIRITRQARKKVKLDGKFVNMPFDTEYLNFDFFKNYTKTSFIRFSSIRPGRTKHDPTVSKLKSLLYLPNGEVKYKVRFDTDYTDLPTRIKKYSSTSEPEPLHYGPLPISASKWKHLQELKKVIPSDYHLFYDNLNY